jgi:transcriptional regulator with XRE-family HTH domain
MTKSPSLREKLDKLFQEDSSVEDLDILLTSAMSLARFDSANELKTHLAEGALLNIGKIGSKALSIPCGEYMVWTTDVGHTMLVPVKEQSEEVFEDVKDAFEIHTPELLQNYSKIERVLAEEMPPQMQGGEQEEQEEPEQEEGEEEGGEDGPPSKHQFQSRVDPGAIDRTPILRAMEQQGHTVTSLASACGVDPPAISRILRIPKDRQGDPGGRNPSIGLASRIANVLRMDVEAMFPDIFGVPRAELGPRQPPANRGSGMAQAAGGSVRKGAASKLWTQGATGQE